MFRDLSSSSVPGANGATVETTARATKLETELTGTRADSGDEHGLACFSFDPLSSR